MPKDQERAAKSFVIDGINNYGHDQGSRVCDYVVKQMNSKYRKNWQCIFSGSPLDFDIVTRNASKVLFRIDDDSDILIYRAKR